MAKAEPKQEVAKVTTLPAGIQTITDEKMLAELDGVEGAGLSDSVEDRGTPLLYVAQKQSPQCEERDAKYIPGLKAGMAFNHLTGEKYEAEKDGVLIAPCFMRVTWDEWTPRDDGGGFHGSHPRNVDMAALKAVPFSKKGKTRRDIFVLPNGHELKLTHKYYVVLADSWTPIVIPMSSTSLGASTRLQALISAQKAAVGDRIIVKPGFWSLFRLKTTFESNDDGSWFQWSGMLERPNMSVPLREFCKQFAIAVAKNAVKEAPPLQDANNDTLEENDETRKIPI